MNLDCNSVQQRSVLNIEPFSVTGAYLLVALTLEATVLKVIRIFLYYPVDNDNLVISVSIKVVFHSKNEFFFGTEPCEKRLLSLRSTKEKAFLILYRHKNSIFSVIVDAKLATPKIFAGAYARLETDMDLDGIFGFL